MEKEINLDKFITVRKDSPDFQKYLENRFSDDYRAIAVDSQNINTELEIVTFELRNSSEFSSIPFIKKLLPLLKLGKFLYFFFPLFYVVLVSWLHGFPMDPITLLLSWFGITFLFLAVNLRADYIDHMIGLDRILKVTSTKPVSLGWVRAYKVKQLSNIFLMASVVVGIPVIVAFPITLAAVACSTIIIYLAVLRPRHSYRSHLLGDVGWAMLLGPVLSVGFELAISGTSRTQTVLFGLVWAVVIFYRLQLQNFEVIMEASIAKIKNGITGLGFDKGKNLILGLWIASLFLFAVFHTIYAHWLYWSSTVLICLYFTYKTRPTFQNLKSPVGSEMASFVKDYHQLYVLLTLLWTANLSFMVIVHIFTRIFY